MNSSKVGKTISFLRKHYGMTQQELAEKLGVTDKAVSRWENGYGTPDISLLSKLSIELDVDIESILEGNFSHCDTMWNGLLFLQYSDGISPMDWLYSIRIVEFQMSLLLLAGIKDITIIGTDEDIYCVKKLLGEGEKYGCSINYRGYKLNNQHDISSTIRKMNIDKNLMIISELSFIFGKDLTRYFKRIINDPGSFGKLMNYVDISSGISFFRKEKYAENCVISNTYLERGVVCFKIKDRYDLFDAASLLKILEMKMGERVYSLEEIALRRGLISGSDFYL